MKVRLASKLKNKDITDSDVDTSWKKTKKCIQEAAEEAIGIRAVTINTIHPCKPWLCQDVKDLAEIEKERYADHYMSNKKETLLSSTS